MATLTEPEPTTRPAGGPLGSRWMLLIVVVAVLAAAAAAVWGIRGLFADPVRGTDAAGVTTIVGSFEPYSCGTPCIGYVQAGSRSVTVILPSGCPAPAREESIRVLGRLDSSQGKAAYRATGCASAT